MLCLPPVTHSYRMVFSESDCAEDKISFHSDFSPRRNDVICARGKHYWDHEGNKMYRTIVALSKDKYIKATSKIEKSLIVSEIVESIHNSGGSFVKQDKEGRWVEVDDHSAREKVSQSLRDNLFDQYRSSTRAKRFRQAILNKKIDGNIDKVVQSNRLVSQRIEKLRWEVTESTLSTDARSICAIFSDANSDILEAIKRDQSLLQEWRQATMTAAC